MKIERIIVGILVVGIISACVIIVLDKHKILKENNRLKEQINNKQEDVKEECTYTETYNFIEYYDFIGTVPTSKFVVVSKFQEFSPKIIEYNESKFNIEFEKGSNYEFTFTSEIRNGRIDYPRLINIVKTDKVGLDQIQESCVIR